MLGFLGTRWGAQGALAALAIAVIAIESNSSSQRPAPACASRTSAQGAVDYTQQFRLDLMAGDRLWARVSEQ